MTTVVNNPGGGTSDGGSGMGVGMIVGILVVIAVIVLLFFFWPGNNDAVTPTGGTGGADTSLDQGGIPDEVDVNVQGGLDTGTEPGGE